MKQLNIKTFFFALVSALTISTAQAEASQLSPQKELNPSTPQEQVIDRVMASVEGVPILESQVNNMLKFLHKKNTPENKKLALKNLIDDAVVQIALRQSKIQVTPQQIESVMENMAAQHGLTYGQLLDALDYDHINVNQYKQNIAHQIMLEKLRGEVINQNIKLDREEVIALGQKLFDEAKEKGDVQKVTEKQYQVRHILLKLNPLLNDKEAKAKLNEIRKEILAGKITFAKAALDYSKDYLTGANGGDLGFAFPNIYSPAFAKTILATPKGKISYPFKTEFGWHILEVTDSRLENVTKDAYMQKAYQELANKQLKNVSEDWVDILRKQANVRYFN